MKRRLALMLPALTMPSHAAPATPHYRPSYHFTPRANWMNDPNGLVHHQGVWHLFFQYHPHSMVWGPMHWGHATSTDLMQWQEHEVALAPDALGMIFSGSAVVDAHNTSGFGKDGRAPLVAVFTHHDMAAEKAGSNAYEHQSLAFSVDDGRSWTPYAGNPVLKSPGKKDFRDPKLRWLPERERWLMALAVGDRISFYSSPDLKQWTHESDFNAAGTQGVWECPDLFPLTLDGRTHWVLLVSVVKGGPNGGSATQYFVGDFDGRRFTAEAAAPRWIDHGPDNYAGVTWSNAPSARTVFIGWMSNWDYATKLPTSPWRSTMTLPRELQLRRVGSRVHLASLPAREVGGREGAALLRHRGALDDTALDLGAAVAASSGRFALRLNAARARSFTLSLSNALGDALRIGFDRAANLFFVDRRHAGLVDFEPRFAGRHSVPRIAQTPAVELLLYFDATSVEVFADGGLSVMTSLFFPRQPFSAMTLASDDGLVLDALSVVPMPVAPAR
jgi:fructan beta-fructosidase